MTSLDPLHFIQGNINHLIPRDHIEEQALLRQTHCPECASSPKCLYCGCKVPQMFKAPLKEDKLKRWTRMLDKDQWEYLKNNIDHIHKFIDGLEYRRRLLQTEEQQVSLPGGEN